MRLAPTRRVVAVSVRLFVGLAAFGFGWILLAVAGLRIPVYETALGVLNAPLAVAVRRFGLAGVNDLIGLAVFLGYYALLALVGGTVAVAVLTHLERIGDRVDA